MTYYRHFAAILDTLFTKTSLIIADGEKVCNSTKDMMILNEDELGSFSTNVYGRKVDLLINCKYNGQFYNLCSSEFKRRNVSDSILLHQQCKNTRINACVMNNLRSLLNQDVSLLSMDWCGREGYMIQMFKYKNVYVSQHLSSLYIPANLLELTSFKKTLKYLFIWKVCTA